MDELVGDHVVDEPTSRMPHGRLADLPVEAEGAGLVAAPPPLLMVPDDELRELGANPAGPPRDPLGQLGSRVVDVPIYPDAKPPSRPSAAFDRAVGSRSRGTGTTRKPRSGLASPEAFSGFT